MTVTADTDRAAWLRERRNGIGASDVPGITGTSPWQSPWSIWADKVGLTPLDEDAADHLTFGRELEPLIARWFHRQTGLYIAGAQTVRHHPDNRRWFATVDGLVADHETIERDPIPDPLGVFESKYTSQSPWDDVPVYYVEQVQWQLACTALPRAWLAVMHLAFGRPQFRIYELDRDDNLIARLTETVDHFWTEHVVTGTPPFPDDHPATAATINTIWGHIPTTKLPVLHLDDYADLIDELTTLRKAKADLRRRLDPVETRVKAVFGAEDPILSEGVIGDNLAVSWRSQPRTDIDIDAVRRDHGNRYDRTNTVRVLRLHGKRLA